MGYNKVGDIHTADTRISRHAERDQPRCMRDTDQQGRKDLNFEPAALETAALPIELQPFG